MDLFAKRFLTTALIALAELLYAVYVVVIFSDFAHFEISYEWIITRLLLVFVGMVASPIIISHVIQWVDNYFRRSTKP